MDAQENKTKMTNPPKTQQTMTQGPKKVMVVALRDFKIGEIKMDRHGQIVDDTTRVIKPGEVVEVDEKRARELCKKIEGAYAFSGERYNNDGDIKRHDLTRARLATKRDLIPDEPLEGLESQGA